MRVGRRASCPESFYLTGWELCVEYLQNLVGCFFILFNFALWEQFKWRTVNITFPTRREVADRCGMSSGLLLSIKVRYLVNLDCLLLPHDAYLNFISIAKSREDLSHPRHHLEGREIGNRRLSSIILVDLWGSWRCVVLYWMTCLKKAHEFGSFSVFVFLEMGSCSHFVSHGEG